jgi:hypothetical protein
VVALADTDTGAGAGAGFGFGFGFGFPVVGFFGPVLGLGLGLGTDLPRFLEVPFLDVMCVKNVNGLPMCKLQTGDSHATGMLPVHSSQVFLGGVWNLPVWPTPRPQTPVLNTVFPLAPVRDCAKRRMLTAAEIAARGPWTVPVPASTWEALPR